MLALLKKKSRPLPSAPANGGVVIGSPHTVSGSPLSSPSSSPHHQPMAASMASPRNSQMAGSRPPNFPLGPPSPAPRRPPRPSAGPVLIAAADTRAATVGVAAPEVPKRPSLPPTVRSKLYAHLRSQSDVTAAMLQGMWEAQPELALGLPATVASPGPSAVEIGERKEAAEEHVAGSSRANVEDAHL